MESKIETSSDTYTQATERIRTLLTDWLESGIDLFLELKKIDESGVWKHPGHATFGDFLRAEFPTALGIERYQNVINAINVYGVDWVRKIGVHACHALTVKALVDDPQKRQLVRASVDQFMATNHCAPDVNKVREIVLGAAPEARKPPKELLEVVELARLRVELKIAKKKIVELEHETKRLQKENKRLAAVDQRRGTAKTNRSAHSAKRKSSQTRLSSSSQRT
jgi:hypothetical protein